MRLVASISIFLQSSVSWLGPLREIWSRLAIMSFLSRLLNLFFTLFSALAPLSETALDMGLVRQIWAASTICGKLILWATWSLTTFLRMNSVGERSSFPLRTAEGTFHDDIRYLKLYHCTSEWSLSNWNCLHSTFTSSTPYFLKAGSSGFGRQVGSKMENASRTGAASWNLLSRFLSRAVV